MLNLCGLKFRESEMNILNSLNTPEGFTIHEFNNDIFVIDNCMSEIHHQEILRFIRLNISNFGKIHSATPEIESYYSDPAARPKAIYVNKEREPEMDRLCLGIFRQIGKAFTRYQDEIHRAQVAIQGDSGYRLSIYDEHNSSYKFHTDAGFTNKNRHVSCIIGLNNDYEGGYLNFPKFDAKFKLGARQCILFPSIYTHPHEVLPVTKGERKTLMTWFI